MSNITITNELNNEIKSIRTRVFVDEQLFPIEDEFDDLDPKSIHFLYSLNNEPVGTIRLVPSTINQECSLGRLAVLKPFRNQNIGTRLVQELINYAKLYKYKRIICNAQVQTVGFYEKLGFKKMGLPLFRECHCLHEILCLDL